MKTTKEKKLVPLGYLKGVKILYMDDLISACVATVLGHDQFHYVCLVWRHG